MSREDSLWALSKAMNPRRLAILLGACVGGLLLTLGLAGLFSPKDWRGTASIEVDAPPARVWGRLTDIASLPQRRPDIQSVSALETDAQGPRR